MSKDSRTKIVNILLNKKKLKKLTHFVQTSIVEPNVRLRLPATDHGSVFVFHNCAVMPFYRNRKRL